MDRFKANGYSESPLLALQFYLLLATLLLSPLPFGGLYEWSWAVLGFLIAILLALSAIRIVANYRQTAPLLRRVWLPALLYLLVAAWVALQATTLTPSTWHPAPWADAAEALGAEFPGRLSLTPYTSHSELLKLLAYGGVFWLAVDHTRERRNARRALWVFAIAATFYAVYGIIAARTELGQTLWSHEMPREPFVTSTFANRSMYAVFAGFGLLIIASLGLDVVLSQSATATKSSRPWQGIIRATPDRLLLLVVMALVSLTALTMTGSRGAILATVLAATVLVFSLRSRNASGPQVRLGLLGPMVLVVLLWVLVFVLVGNQLASRLPGTFSGDLTSRLLGYEMILSAIAEAPLSGFGAGSFKEVFFSHNSGELWQTFNYPHNLYLGTAVELGIPAAATLLVAVALLATSCLAGIKRRHRDHVMPALGVAAVTMVAIHGFVDSPLYLPANAAIFSFLLGLAYAQAWPSSARRPNCSVEAAPCPAEQWPPEAAAAQSE